MCPYLTRQNRNDFFWLSQGADRPKGRWASIWVGLSWAAYQNSSIWEPGCPPLIGTMGAWRPGTRVSWF